MKAQVKAAGFALIALILASCGDDPPLPGQRYDVRTPLAETADGTAAPAAVQDPTAAVRRDVAFPMPAQVNHSEWTHRGGSAVHRISHPALGASLQPVWTASIGSGDTRKLHITADPVVADGRVFTLDARSTVMAHSTGGAEIWSRNLTPASDRSGEASGGGIAYGGGKLFVSTGFGRLHALNPATGAILWEQRFDTPVAGAPTVRGDLVYVSSRDNRAFAVRTDNGRLVWQLPAGPSVSATVNGAGPAVDDRVALFPFGSAELLAALPKGGVRTWSTTLAGRRAGYAFALISDISADPVVVGNAAYVGSPAGRIAKIDTRTGERLWTATEGAMSPVWVDGGSVFAVSDIQQLIRLNAETGELIWSVDLPRFKKQKPRKYRDVFAHYGPVLAGGRLLVASDDGVLRSFDPRNGNLISEVAIPGGGATTNPVVVNRTLYLVTTKGQLVAFR